MLTPRCFLSVWRVGVGVHQRAAFGDAKGRGMWLRSLVVPLAWWLVRP